ncbi:MAG: hypothetical protein CBE33_01065 [Candidatus Pelagibacter sp. TMED273]|nr:MAG: hypothetical protein CBE33_01065 [Candidatus Pelagibacter sp. TMED273]
MKRIIYAFLVKILYLFNYQFGFPIYSLPDGGMGSHKKYLKFIINNLNKTNLTVVEAGSGDNSTGLFLKELKNKNYVLYSFENNVSWHNKMSRKYKNSNIEFILIKGKSFLPVEKHLNDANVTEIDLTFIDSAPWESRTEVKDLLTDISDIVCIHDVDYFPHNNIWGEESSEIKNKPKNKYFYGDLDKENLGCRNYDNEFKFWVEIFPIKPGYYTGPPLLVGSNKLDIRSFFNTDKPKGIYFFSK